MGVTKEVSIDFPVRISRHGLEQLRDEIAKVFGTSRFVATYTDKSRATFESLEALMHSNLTRRLDINRLEIEAGEYGENRISLILDNERRRSRIDLDLKAEGISDEFENRTNTILKGMAPSQPWFRSTVVTFFVTALVMIIAYILLSLFATKVLKFARIPFYFELLAFAIGYGVWGAHTTFFPWVGVEFAGAHDRYAKLKTNGMAIFLGVVTYYITKGLDLLFSSGSP